MHTCSIARTARACAPRTQDTVGEINQMLMHVGLPRAEAEAMRPHIEAVTKKRWNVTDEKRGGEGGGQGGGKEESCASKARDSSANEEEANVMQELRQVRFVRSHRAVRLVCPHCAGTHGNPRALSMCWSMHLCLCSRDRMHLSNAQVCLYQLCSRDRMHWGMSVTHRLEGLGLWGLGFRVVFGPRRFGVISRPVF